ncbi:hypothetical protein WAK64_07000 [Bacillus spongiae]|uniref:Uncharacterized protein n=1 Tax=Bacillus spongiae TaxID=2683610 RepID=A0ABU8HBZ2_9BACI
MWQWIILILSPFLLFILIEEAINIIVNKLINPSPSKDRKRWQWILLRLSKVKKKLAFKKSVDKSVP